MIEKPEIKTIPNTDGRYGITSTGRVYRMTPWHGREAPYELKPVTNKYNNYKHIMITINKQPVRIPIHHAVMQAYGPPQPEGYNYVRHKGDRSDNSVENLYWDNKSSSNAIKDDIREQIRKEEGTHKEIATKYGVSFATVGRIKKAIPKST